MAEFEDLLDRSSLMIFQATSAEEAVSEVRALLDAAESEDIAIWGWTAGEGLAPLSPAGDAIPELAAGDHAGSAAAALQQWRLHANDRFLLLFGADALPTDVSHQAAIQDQLDSPGNAWTGLVCLESDLPAKLLSRSKVPAHELTVDIRRRGAPGKAARRPARKRRALTPTDIEDLGRFDNREWTEYLQDLPPSVLAEICKKGLYQKSVDRVRALSADLKKLLIDKDELIDLMTWCSVAHLPMLLLGTWGTGKSMLVRQFSSALGISPGQRSVVSEDSFIAQLKGIKDGGGEALDQLHDIHDGRHFEYLVTRFTTPEELLGPVNVDLLLSHAVYLRQTRSLMPRAEIVFLDEVFKANSSILNALLSLINERLFYNAGVPWTVNMVMLFGASNEPPQEEELGAFYDRFPIRALCDPVSNDRLRALLQRSHELQYASLLPGAASDRERALLDPSGELASLRLEQTACVNDFRLLRRVALYKFGGPDITGPSDKSQSFVDEFLTLLHHLRDEYDISDRSAGHLFRLARARALLERREDAGLGKEDLKVFYYCGKSPETLRRLPGIVDELIG